MRDEERVWRGASLISNYRNGDKEIEVLLELLDDEAAVRYLLHCFWMYLTVF